MKYTMKEVVNILGTDDSKQNEAVELHSDTVSDMNGLFAHTKF